MPTVYTVITNHYDKLKEPTFVTPGWEYVCLTDDDTINSDVWTIKKTTAHNRYLKINALFDGLTLYVDGSIEITGDLNEFIAEVPRVFTIWRHPARTCTFTEAEAVIKLKGMNPNEVYKQMQRYAMDGFPRNYGLGQNAIMLRDLSDKRVRDICDVWWKEWEAGVKRDQLSLIYSFWKLGYYPDFIEQNVINKYFIWHNHESRNLNNRQQGSQRV